jgi:hypothetical protein
VSGIFDPWAARDSRRRAESRSLASLTSMGGSAIASSRRSVSRSCEHNKATLAMATFGLPSMSSRVALWDDDMTTHMSMRRKHTGRGDGMDETKQSGDLPEPYRSRYDKLLAEREAKFKAIVAEVELPEEEIKELVEKLDHGRPFPPIWRRSEDATASPTARAPRARRADT